jgi:CheY-like chemotaxis protein
MRTSVIPVRSDPRSQASPSDDRGTSPAAAKDVLLLVEDEPAVLHLAEAILESQGYTVLTATDGQDGLRLARENRGPAIRLVLTDVFMPKMGGKEMVQLLRAGHSDLKVIYTSGFIDDIVAEEILLDPGLSFLPKPYTPDLLIRKVRELLGGPT